ncbi:MBL fold metallo-hydrolase [Massiliimalia massiliensis]|uniref:MBL fold metallo-hydrolase n=1 Tax=Massiliimalia massiliensis TaxID=1852384 RepID=UPI0009860D91|nr:MBL fold metallo-hydrolase [Massiliimalia massiliensis]
MSKVNLYQVHQVNDYTYIIAEDLDHQVDTMALVIGKKKAALIDTGAGIGNLREVVEELTDLPVMVLTTHLHTDHAGGNPLFDEIYVNERDAFLMPESMGLDFRMRYVRACVTDNPDKLNQIEKGINRVTSFDYQSIDDGDIIDLGGITLRTIAFPGHTPGSLMFYDESSRILFSGDSVNPSPWLFLEYSVPLHEYLDKLRQLKPLLAEAGRIYCGHGVDALEDEVVPDLEECCLEILGGAAGKPTRTVGGDACKYRHGCVTVFYNPEKL